LIEISLPDDLVWEDEYDFTPVTQESHITLTGEVIIETATQNGLRPMTLGGGEDEIWISKAVLDALFASVNNDAPGEMSLSWRGAQYTVIWRHDASPPIEATPINECYDPDDTDLYAVRLKFWII
jgi:hypothetical protein